MKFNLKDIRDDAPRAGKKMVHKCEACGHEHFRPLEDYSYNGTLAPHLDKILTGFLAGMSYGEIAKAIPQGMPLFHTIEAIKYIARRYGHAKPAAKIDFARLAQRDKQICAQHAEGGVTLKEVGKYYGISGSRVAAILDKERNRRYREIHAAPAAPIDASTPAAKANDLPPRIREGFSRFDEWCGTVTTLGEVAKMKDRDLLDLPGIGRKAVGEIRAFLADHGVAP